MWQGTTREARALTDCPEPGVLHQHGGSASGEGHVGRHPYGVVLARHHVVVGTLLQLGQQWCQHSARSGEVGTHVVSDENIEDGSGRGGVLLDGTLAECDRVGGSRADHSRWCPTRPGGCCGSHPPVQAVCTT